MEMIETLLKPTGVPFKRTRFPQPPKSTYAVYMDDVETDGPDGINAILRHNVTVELYEPKPDAAAEAAIEAQLDAAGLTWTKQDRYWLQDTQRYQVIYEFTHIEKRRV